ncbi:MAG: glycine cleavage system protein H [Gammaproteobacteria bacterium]|nr:glycine cleavage system protein H [Gammaproteobacteria bacterium]
MAQVRGCELPDDLLYDVQNNIWYRENDDGTVTVGMTAIAGAMAGQIVAITPKRAGRKVVPGRSCATVESGKWVGPAKLLSGGEVVEVNQDIVSSPGLANSEPYGNGWLLKVKVDDWGSIKSQLTVGTDVAAPYESKMDADGFEGCNP